MGLWEGLSSWRSGGLCMSDLVTIWPLFRFGRTRASFVRELCNSPFSLPRCPQQGGLLSATSCPGAEIPILPHGLGTEPFLMSKKRDPSPHIFLSPPPLQARHDDLQRFTSLLSPSERFGPGRVVRFSLQSEFPVPAGRLSVESHRELVAS